MSTAREVTPALKAKGPCECGVDACGLFGTLGRPDRNGKRHVRGCKAFGCRVCLGKYSRTKGDRKAATARKALNIGGVLSRHEEVWGGSLRIEVKAGAQVRPAITAFEKCAAQSEASRPIGDNRPFAAVFMPDGEKDGIVAVRLSQVYEFATAVLENAANA